jgi:glycosyltransferase involved in cell wall biosynthesis
MKQPLDCFIGADCLPWEKQYFGSIAEALSSKVDIRRVEPSSPASQCPIWVIGRDWRRLLRCVPHASSRSVFVSLLGTLPDASWMAFLRRAWQPVAKRNLVFLSHSPFLNRFLSEMERIAPAHCVPMDLPAAPVECFAPSTGPMRVGFLHGLNADANLGFLVSVVHSVANLGLDVEFTVPGHGALSSHLSSLAADLGLTNKFRRFSQTPVAFDVLLYAPIKSENFIPFLLAGAQAAPMVSIQLPGVEKFVAEGRSGLVLPVESVESVGKAIKRLVSDRDLVRSMGSQAQAHLARHFPLENWLDNFVGVVLGEKPAAPMWGQVA